MLSLVCWVVFCVVAGIYDGIVYHNFNWGGNGWLWRGLHLPHVFAWVMRVVVCVGLFATPSWVFAALVVSAGLMLPFLHTMAYGVTRALLDERLWETHGWWMHTSSGGDGWRRYFPDQNPWVRLSLFVVGAIFMAYYEVHYSGQ